MACCIVSRIEGIDVFAGLVGIRQVYKHEP